MMFANQAGASAILVVVVHRHGTGAERAIDVLVGGASAYVIGVLLFPSQPLPRIYEAERAVLAELAAALGAVAVRLAEGGAVEPGFTMQTGYRIHELLGRVAIARSTALLNVRLAPRRWRLRAVVEREEMRISRLDLLANAVLSLVRVTSRALDDAEPVPGALSDQIVALRDAIERLASTQHPWPASLRADVDAVAAGAIAHVQAQPVSRVPVIGSILRSTAADVQALIQAETAV
jgi:uncharacterized membrane protein YgaE (UPF0421/DUF939 family)